MTSAIVIGLLMAVAATAHPQEWTPHSAAALLDASFPTERACRHALADARRRERTGRADPVHGLSYAHLFKRGRCAGFHHDGAPAWRIRMHWKRR